MDYSAERHFVEAFIRKSRRERLLHELATPKKRYEGVSRFCHQARELLEPSRILMEGEDMDRREEFKGFIAARDELCFVLSPDPVLDERFMGLKEAAAQAAICPDAVVIMGSSFAVVFGEPVKGGREKYLLAEKARPAKK